MEPEAKSLKLFERPLILRLPWNTASQAARSSPKSLPYLTRQVRCANNRFLPFPS
jgi:hypothetical protein